MGNTAAATKKQSHSSEEDERLAFKIELWEKEKIHRELKLKNAELDLKKRHAITAMIPFYIFSAVLLGLGCIFVKRYYCIEHFRRAYTNPIMRDRLARGAGFTSAVELQHKLNIGLKPVLQAGLGVTLFTVPLPLLAYMWFNGMVEPIVQKKGLKYD